MSGRPTTVPRLVLLHGAGTDPRAFTHWPADFPDHDVSAPDLQAGLNVATVGMDDYARAAREALTAPLSGPLYVPQPTVVCGWSMGGLIALMLAAPHAGPVALSAVVVIEPSPPSQLGGQHPEVRSARAATTPTTCTAPARRAHPRGANPNAPPTSAAAASPYRP